MSYYDSIKDNVKNDGSGEAESTDASFDTLKEAAEETSNEPDEEQGDGTPIEVLDEEGLSEKPPSQDKSSSNQSRSQKNESRQSSESSGSSGSNPLTSDGSGNVEEKLDRIIEQNEKMIEILESFGS